MTNLTTYSIDTVTVEEFEDDFDYSVSIADGVYSIDTSGVSFSLSDLYLEPQEMHTPPPQPDLFRHYVTSQWLHSSHLADEDPQWQAEAWIKSQPHLSEAYVENKLEVDYGNCTDHIDYYYMGTNPEHCMWRLRWSEMFDETTPKPIST